MASIQSLLNKIASMANRTGLFSIQKNEFFDTLSDITNKVKEVNDNVNSVAKSLIWQSPVATFADLATTYPGAVQGWAAMVTGEGLVYSFNGSLPWKSTGLTAFPQKLLTFDSTQVLTSGQKIQAKKNIDLGSISTKNKFNKYAITDGYYILDIELPNVEFWLSEYMSIESESYFSNQSFSFISYFDVDKNNISHIASAGQQLITPPPTAVYFRISEKYAVCSIDTLQVESGNSATGYEDYFIDINTTINEKLSLKEQNLTYNQKFQAKKNIDLASISTKNKFNKHAILDGYYQNGNIPVADAESFLSDFIETNGVVNISNQPFSFLLFFDSYKNYIGKVTSAGQYLITPIANAVYFKISEKYSTCPIDALQIEIGNSVTEFEDYFIDNVEKKAEHGYENLNEKKTLKEVEIGNVVTPKLLKYSQLDNINSALPNFAYFLGRWFNKIIDGVNCACTINQGSEFFFRVKNTSYIALDLKNINSAGNNPYLAISIDGSDFTRYQVGNGNSDLIFANNLTLSEHYVRIIVDGIQEHDEKWATGQGFVISKVIVGAGGISESFFPKNKKGLFIGDSITEGINVRGIGAIPLNNSGQLSFPFIACKKLNACAIRDGFGASGVTHGGSGGVPKAIDTLDFAYNGISLIMDSPDFIVINHGTNDVGYDSYSMEYQLLVNRLQIKYSGSPIFCIIPFNGAKRDEVIALSSTNNLILIDTLGWGITTSDGTHPDIVGHQKAGVKIAEEIQRKLGASYFN